MKTTKIVSIPQCNCDVIRLHHGDTICDPNELHELSTVQVRGARSKIPYSSVIICKLYVMCDLMLFYLQFEFEGAVVEGGGGHNMEDAGCGLCVGSLVGRVLVLVKNICGMIFSYFPQKLLSVSVEFIEIKNFLRERLNSAAADPANGPTHGPLTVQTKD